MRIFITGAAGFIGFHAAKTLSKEHACLGFDNFNSYYDPALKRARAAALDIPIVEGNLTDKALLTKTVQDFQPTHILHLAAQAGVRTSIETPQRFVDTNITGFLNILELCKEGPKLVYASSSSVYGDTFDQTDVPISLYGATKKANELMAHAYHKCFGVHATGLRYFTVYGPWGRPDMAVYKFTQAILAGRPIPIYNNGQLSRDFTYIDDIIAGTVAALELSAPYEIFNLGNHKAEALLDLITLLEDGLGKKAIREYLPMQTGDVLESFADISRSQEILGYQPTTSLAEGIGKFLEWHKEFQVALASTDQVR